MTRRRTREQPVGELLAGAPMQREAVPALEDFPIEKVSTSAELAAVVDLMRTLGISELRLGRLGVALAPGDAPGPPLTEFGIDTIRTDADADDPFSDPDLYPEGKVPSLDDEG